MSVDTMAVVVKYLVILYNMVGEDSTKNDNEENRDNKESKAANNSTLVRQEKTPM